MNQPLFFQPHTLQIRDNPPTSVENFPFQEKSTVLKPLIDKFADFLPNFPDLQKSDTTRYYQFPDIPQLPLLQRMSQAAFSHIRIPPPSLSSAFLVRTSFSESPIPTIVPLTSVGLPLLNFLPSVPLTFVPNDTPDNDIMQNEHSEEVADLKYFIPPKNLKDYRSFLELGIEFLNEKHYKAAIMAFGYSFMLNQSDFFICILLSKCHHILSNNIHAEMSAESGLCSDPLDSQWLLLKGICHFKSEKYETAKTAFQTVIQAHPEDKLAQFFLNNLEKIIKRSQVNTSLPSKASIRYNRKKKYFEHYKK